jgi:DNA-binding NarL/FixJ family response regulator
VGVKVLVVDDSDALRARLTEMLREVCGDDGVREAAGADEGLVLVGEMSPDVVVLDLHMPGKNGLSILAKLKAAACPPLVIVLTNDPSEAHRRESMSQGADHFFDKSKDFGRVVDVVVDLERTRATRRS